MAYDTADLFDVGVLVDADRLNDGLFEPLRYLNGSQVGQTETDRQVEVQAPYFEASDSIFDLEAQFASPDTHGEVQFVGSNAAADPEIVDGQSLTLEAWLDVNGASAEKMGSIEWKRVQFRYGEVRLRPSAATAGLHIAGHGGVGIWGDAERGKALKVHGTLNATGYRLNGAVLNDWTAGVGVLTWTGSAKARRLHSSRATGSAPLAVTSTTEVAGNAELLDGHTWHHGIKAFGSASIPTAAVDVEVCTRELDRDGRWEIWVQFRPYMEDSDIDFTCKIKDDGGSTVATAPDVRTKRAYDLTSLVLRGSVTATAGDLVRATVQKSADTAATPTSSASATIVAIWRAP